MSGKKKGPVSWKLAGEPVYPPAMPPADESAFSEKFSFHREFRSDHSDTELVVSPSVMRTRESAARAALGLLCKEFRAKYYF